MRNSPLLRAERRRHVPDHFSWIDHRLIRDGYIPRGTVTDWAVYLVLVAVADRNGMSFYSDLSLCRMLRIAPAQLNQARRHLQEVELIAWEEPFYQVLSLHTPCTRQHSTPRNDRPEQKPASPEQVSTLVQQFLARRSS